MDAAVSAARMSLSVWAIVGVGVLMPLSPSWTLMARAREEINMVKKKDANFIAMMMFLLLLLLGS